MYEHILAFVSYAFELKTSLWNYFYLLICHETNCFVINELFVLNMERYHDKQLLIKN